MMYMDRTYIYNIYQFSSQIINVISCMKQILDLILWFKHLRDIITRMLMVEKNYSSLFIHEYSENTRVQLR